MGGVFGTHQAARGGFRRLHPPYTCPRHALLPAHPRLPRAVAARLAHPQAKGDAARPGRIAPRGSGRRLDCPAGEPPAAVAVAVGEHSLLDAQEGLDGATAQDDAQGEPISPYVGAGGRDPADGRRLDRHGDLGPSRGGPQPNARGGPGQGARECRDGPGAGTPQRDRRLPRLGRSAAPGGIRQRCGGVPAEASRGARAAPQGPRVPRLCLPAAPGCGAPRNQGAAAGAAWPCRRPPGWAVAGSRSSAAGEARSAPARGLRPRGVRSVGQGQVAESCHGGGARYGGGSPEEPEPLPGVP